MSFIGDLQSILILLAIPFYLVGLIGNILVIRIVHKTREMHTTTNYLLVNLAVSDITTILLAPIFPLALILQVHLSNDLGKFLCKFTALVEISGIASVFTLTVLAVERYHALLKPFRTGLRLSNENIKKAISLIWVSSTLLCSPDFVFRDWSESQSICVGPWTLYMNKATKIHVIVISVLSIYIPLAIMLYCYGSLIRGLYFTNTICPITAGERSLEKERLVITFILVTAGFSICYAPTVVFNNVVAFKDVEDRDWKLYTDLYFVVSFVLVCSLCLNPILYAFRSANFQEGFKRVILCQREPEPHNPGLQLEDR